MPVGNSGVETNAEKLVESGIHTFKYLVLFLTLCSMLGQTEQLTQFLKFWLGNKEISEHPQ